MADSRQVWSGLFAFFATAAVLSIALNGYLLWKLYRPNMTVYMASFKRPAPVSPEDHTRGPADARVTIVEYGDFQCPYCRELNSELIQLQPKLHFRWIYRQYPLEMHQNAEPFAEASECAADQGKFWEFADAVFAKPPAESDAATLTDWAGPLGLDQVKFKACLTGGGGRARVATERAEGDAILVGGTPTFFVNGQRHQGDLPLDQLSGLITNANR